MANKRVPHKNFRSENQRSKKDLVALTYSYLLNNFHKFSQANKIKVALAIQSKIIVEHRGTVTHEHFLGEAIIKSKGRDDGE